jgi:uncharacterized protein
MITQEMIPAMQGVVPSSLATCSASGVPNVAVISQAYYVNETHVALSFQFFNKTIKNVRENPHASLQIIHPGNFDMWVMDIEYDRSETEGPLFDQMDMQLEAIASMSGMADIFKLRAADIYKVKSVTKVPHSSN